MRIRSKGLFRLLVIVLLAATVVIVSAATLMRLSPNSKTGAQASNAQSPERNRKIAQMESELITITPHGFEPLEITRPAGSFLLFIEDRSGFEHVSPQFSRLAGLRVFNLRIPREQPDWSDVLNLQPGVYILSDPDHPTWLCRVTITP